MAEPIGIVFDLDGTILDDAHLLPDITKTITPNYGIHVTDAEILTIGKIMQDEIRGKRSRFLVVNAVLKLAKYIGIPWYQRIHFLRDVGKFYRANIKQCPLIKGTMESLKEIKSKYGPVGIYTTSSQKELHQRFEDRMGLLEIFNNAIITRDMLKTAKPNPKGLEMLSEQWNIPLKRLIMVGDAGSDIETGKNAGSTTIGVLTGLASKKDLQEAESDYILNDITEIPALLSKLNL